MIRWGPADCADRAAPATAAALLERAMNARPGNALLRLKKADFDLDRYDFAAAATSLEAALGLDPDLAGARPRLARCYNALGRHRDALGTLSRTDGPELERALAFVRLGLEPEAELELRALLDLEPRHRPACRQLGKILRRSGRIAELLDLCETLHARGAAHAQLFYVWGMALALSGREEEARGLLLDRARVTEHALPAPDGFADIADFNAALAEEILGNPYRLSDFPAQDEANRGSSRVHALFGGRRPELVQGLLDSLQALIAAQAPTRRGAFDPWFDARPERAHLKAWGLIQRGGDYEEWHSHPGGWMSGVYYVRVPGCVTADGEGPGCIEFGPPTALARERPGFVPVRRHAPSEGRLLLAPSHFAHRTIPTGAAEHRISFAFDIVPD
ncbi:MAG TPA: putative 2OG-Fe(II) oxygenase [Allosphingosinicella sp.]|nr:putative 2OG-Fe(II) oxygenase [Allosphingosinicella sp.]